MYTLYENESYILRNVQVPFPIVRFMRLANSATVYAMYGIWYSLDLQYDVKVATVQIRYKHRGIY